MYIGKIISSLPKTTNSNNTQTMQIINSTPNDIKAIFELYDEAIAYQKKVFDKHWQGFDQHLVATEIAENRQWKIMVDNQIACIFAITFNDAAIWGEKDQQPSIYIHRIVTNPAFRGGFYVKHIVEWAKKYAKQQNKRFVRMDTWGDNQKLIDYYTQCGFTFVGIITPNNRNTLPKHYSAINLSLFEIEIAQEPAIKSD